MFRVADSLDKILVPAESSPRLEIRPAGSKGLGVFTVEPIARGAWVLCLQGKVLRGADLTDDLLAVQIDDDVWLASDGSLVDDRVNHSCDPNVGFLDGTPNLFALRNIAAGEEITWDYSTSISEPGWFLECQCGAVRCRGIVRPWPELTDAERERLKPIALNYLRTRDAPTHSGGR
jgi:SET domain-containing protein